MPSYTITEVMSETREWKSRDGARTFVSHKVRLEGEEKLAEFSRPLGGTSPVVGQVFEGYELKDKGDFPPELRKQGSGGRSNGGGAPQRSPEERNSIVRQHSQHMAVMWAAILMKVHTDPPMKPNYEWLKGVIDWFDRDAKGEPQP